MAIYLKDKKITPYRGDYKPVNIYQGAQKIAGWHNESKQGDSVEFSGTYNDSANVVMHGNSEQVQTVQGKSILDITKYSSIGREAALSGGVFTCHKLETWSVPVVYSKKVSQMIVGNTYTLSMKVLTCDVSATSFSIVTLSGTTHVNTVISNNGGAGTVLKATITPSGDFDSVKIFIARSWESAETSNITLGEVQLELGSTATTYEPFVPNSPSPDYPSTIRSAGSCNLSSSNADGSLVSTVAIPELRAIALPETATEWTYIRDGVKYWADTARYVGGGWWDVVRRCGLYVFTGVNPYYINKNDSAAGSYLYHKNLPGKQLGVGLSTHFYHTGPALANGINGRGSFTANSTWGGVTAWFNFYGIVSADNATLPNATEANAWLAAQHAAGTPVTVLYQLATPTTERIHLGTLASFPRYTHVEQIQDGLKAWMELECKVINNI